MDYNQLREILVNTEALYSIWQATGMDEKEFILANGGLIQETEKARIQKEQTKARQVKFLEKQKAKGNRTLTAIVSGDTYDRLTRLRDKAIQAGEKKSLGEVLDELLSGSKTAQADKLDVIQKIAEHRDAGLTWPAIATALNDKKLFTGRGKKWTSANALTFFKRRINHEIR